MSKNNWFFRLTERLHWSSENILRRTLALLYGGTLLMAFVASYDLYEALVVVGYLWAVYTVALAIGFGLPSAEAT